MKYILICLLLLGCRAKKNTDSRTGDGYVIAGTSITLTTGEIADSVISINDSTIVTIRHYPVYMVDTIVLNKSNNGGTGTTSFPAESLDTLDFDSTAKYMACGNNADRVIFVVKDSGKIIAYKKYRQSWIFIDADRVMYNYQMALIKLNYPEKK